MTIGYSVRKADLKIRPVIRKAGLRLDYPALGAPAYTQIPVQNNYVGDDVSLDISGFFTDIDAPFTYGMTGHPTGLVIDPATGVISGIIADGQTTFGHPPATFEVTVSSKDATGKIGYGVFNWVVLHTALGAFHVSIASFHSFDVTTTSLYQPRMYWGAGAPVQIASAGAGLKNFTYIYGPERTEENLAWLRVDPTGTSIIDAYDIGATTWIEWWQNIQSQEFHFDIIAGSIFNMAPALGTDIYRAKAANFVTGGAAGIPPAVGQLDFILPGPNLINPKTGKPPTVGTRIFDVG